MKYIVGCLENLDVTPNELDGIFISHEHSDHINGAGVLSRNQKLPLWTNSGTWEIARNKLGRIHQHNLFQTERPVRIKDLEILPIPVSHKATEPVCFRIQQNSSDLRLGIVTDIGILTPPVKHYLHNVDLLMLESNYDLDMLVNGTYPENVKLFILGELGHLSNQDAGESLVELLGDRTNHVLLSHISKDNNKHRLAYDTVSTILKKNGFNNSMLKLTYQNKMGEEISLQ
jgi:phosphoribosyl 1,2-cyclic phosphodiesterase